MLKLILHLSLGLLSMLLAQECYARGGHHGGGFHGGGGFYGHGGWGTSLYFGSPFFPYYPYTPYYYPPTVIVPTEPPVYIEQEPASKPQPPSAWNYCPNPQGYYPYIKECSAGWQAVAPQPAGQEPGYWYYCQNPAGYYPYQRTCPLTWQKITPN